MRLRIHQTSLLRVQINSRVLTVEEELNGSSAVRQVSRLRAWAVYILV